MDTITATTMSLDLNKTLRHRDYFIIDGIAGGLEREAPPTPPVEITEYDEGLVFLNGTDTGTGTFNFTFSNNPIVVLTPETDSMWGENVNVYGFARTTSGFTFGISAPFSGNIRYRAIHSPTYPAFCTSSFTSSITASAGTATLLENYHYTASFAALPGVPFKFLQTAWNPGTMHDVAFQTQNSSSNSANVEISAPVSTTVHFIAYYP